ENSDQVIEYVDLIRLTSLYLDISDAKMENGSLRVDLNISNAFINEKTLGQKVEIKNLNSLNNLALAIDKEIKEQTSNLLSGEKILQVTKKFDDQSKELRIMRQKDQILDYKYLPEFDIPPIKISDSLLKEAQINDLPWTKKEKYLSQNISNEHTKQLIRSIDKMEFFDSLTYFDKNKASNIFFKEIVSYANKNNGLINQLNINPSDFDELLKINFPSSLYKQIIPFLVNNKLSINDLLEKHNLKVINDEIELKQIITKIWDANLNYITKNIKNEKRIRKLLIGQVMAETKGLANPEILNKIITFMIEGIINK
ncbi:MAG: Asp-tRNA(Asn)/Glu-tRNA(Gln) amidotransferase GatCAB subunit B, partial [Mycoplasma sp.]|nr:Asp-tRNA(Asn)/Glu-tRNA(Gln) amidotransferase GatCAB subunit B [Mycoplasma sp.]